MFGFKGKSLIEFPDNYVVVDLETTGLDFEYCSIIEIAALKIEDNKIVETFSSLIKPPKIEFFKSDKSGEMVLHQYYVPEFIADLTGITNEMLETAPLPEDVFPKFYDFVGDNFIVGHNVVSFDGNFLCCAIKDYMDAEFSNNYIDTLRISRRLLKELSHHRLSDLSLFFNIDYSNAHRSEKDCLITYECFNRLKEEAKTQYGSVENFLKSLERKPRKKFTPYVNAKNIEATVDKIDTENPFYGKRCVFTGTLERMTRREAMQTVKNLGGENENSVTKKTNFLIIGNLEFSNSIKEGKSSKMLKAEKYKSAGQDIEIISENTFYAMLED